MVLPDTLNYTLETLLSEAPPKALAKAARRLTDRYQDGIATSAPGRLTPDEALAYAAIRMPGTFGAIYRALREAQTVASDLNPQSLLDIGSGPGTAIGAALTIFPTITSVTAIEREPAMQRLGARFLKAQTTNTTLRWVSEDISHATFVPHDLVIAAYVLGELPPSTQATVVQNLWDHSTEALLLIEPGTPAGFARIRDMRDRLRRQGAHILAPCPHEGVCPLPQDDWCHFAERIPRSRRQRQLKGGVASYEDEKFSYVVLSRSEALNRSPRILRHPLIAPGRIQLTLCTDAGVSQETLTKKMDESFKSARKRHWGDVWEPTEPPK